MKTIAFFLAFIVSLPVFSDAPIGRIENGLLPAVLIVGAPAYSLQDRMHHYKVPGLSIAVWRNYEILWSKGYGVLEKDKTTPVTPHTLFQAGSISKTLTAAAVCKLVEQGKVSFDAPINDLLKSWQLPENDFTKNYQVRVRHILSHTAGLNVPGFPGFEKDDPLPTLIQELNGLSPSNTLPIRVEDAPGKQFQYSGGGYLILQQMLVDVEKRAFEQLMSDLILRPAKMTSSTFDQPLRASLRMKAASGHSDEEGIIPPGKRVYPEKAVAGLWTTSPDLARFVISLQKSAAGHKNSLLSAAVAKQMLTGVSESGGFSGFGVVLLNKRGVTYFAHPGGNAGYFAIFYASPDEGFGAAIMTNAESGELVAPEIVRAIAKEYQWENFLPAPVTTLPSDSNQIAGRYKIDEDTVLTVTETASGLEAVETLSEPFLLFRVSDNEWIRNDQPIRYRFKKDEVEILNGETSKAKEISAYHLTPFELLQKGDVVAGMKRYQALPTQPSVLSLRDRGLRLLKEGKTSAAIAVLEWNAQIHPDAAAAHDALAQAYSVARQKQKAVATSRKVLEALKTDFTSTASWREVFRKRALKQIATP
jgi:CubicO group peptidase (beta-lactamase class C family)